LALDNATNETNLELMRSTATLSSKSQITIPAWARRRLGLAPGARVRLQIEGDRLVIEPAGKAIEELEGALQGVYGDPDGYVEALRDDRLP